MKLGNKTNCRVECIGCYRNVNGICEGLKSVPKEGCWAKQTDKAAYIQEQRDIIKYNTDHSNPDGVRMAEKSIRRVGW